jgi:hypothetical protein
LGNPCGVGRSDRLGRPGEGGIVGIDLDVGQHGDDRPIRQGVDEPDDQQVTDLRRE